MTSRAPVLIAPVLALALTLAACSSPDPEPAPAPEETEEAAPVEVSPLTGLPFEDGRPENPVLVVKVENTAAGAPQTGLTDADLVVEELVEGGITRLAAFYYTELPETVGHVRSMRGTDISIAAPVDGTLIASGGAGGTLSKIRDAGLTYLTEDAGDPGFSGDPALSRPYNRLVDLTSVVEAAPEPADEPLDPYLQWTPPPEDGAAEEGSDAESEGSEPTAPEPTPATSASVRFSPASTTTWELDDDQWVRTNGHAGDDEFRADTLITLECEVGDAGYLDPSGSSVPETIVEGSGAATVLTKDGALDVTWEKEDVASTIVLTTEDGEELTIDPGKVWIELIPEGDGSVQVD